MRKICVTHRVVELVPEIVHGVLEVVLVEVVQPEPLPPELQIVRAAVVNAHEGHLCLLVQLLALAEPGRILFFKNS